MRKKPSYDFLLVLATTAVLFIISLICIYGMFYFKAAQVNRLAPAAKAAYMGRMNGVVAPFVVGLILLLGICIPKRLFPTGWLHRFTFVLIAASALASLVWGVPTGLLVVLLASLGLQLGVLALAIVGSKRLHFEKKGYWVRLGSSLIHLGVVLFVLDLFFYRHHTLHLLLFWVTTTATVFGMTFCFYADWVVGLVARDKAAIDRKEG
ncbi:MAG: hypothetical protein P8075_21715 [Deltaproteobacteria bacterium]